MTEPVPAPIEFLQTAVESLAPLQRPDGGLDDPVFRQQTQYGTAFFGWCCAVLADQADPVWRGRARAALTAALEHTSRPDLPAHASGFDRVTLGVTSRGNHRDFTWPPILRTFAALGSDADQAAVIAGVDPERSFNTRPPSNWSAVWMSGEWLRMQAGLASTTVDTFDDWLDVFFEQSIDIDSGLYAERGLPNAYDLFTRVHLADLLAAGYDGRNRERLQRFLTAGLRRSLALQLSDGSVASGFRSTAQTWVLGAQISYFTTAREIGLGDADDQQQALVAAWRAYDSIQRWQRPDAEFSPVQNLHRPELRIGYEGYTSDGHYSPLALAFVATAVSRGFGQQTCDRDTIAVRPSSSWAEAEPSWRAVAHRGRISAAVQAAADQVYDGCGVVDLTFGIGRRLHLTTSARHLSGGPWLNPGLAVSDGLFSAADPISGHRQTPTGEIRQLPDGLEYATTIVAEENTSLSGIGYRLSLTLADDAVTVREQIDGEDRELSLLVPYLLDDGGQPHTELSWLPGGARLVLGDEELIITVDGELSRQSVVPDGYQNRRGRCGLIRLDLARPGTAISWSVQSLTAS